MNDKQLLIISIIISIIGIILISSTNYTSNKDLKIVNITSTGKIVDLSFCSNISGMYESGINKTGPYAISYSRLGEDFYYITGLQLLNGSG